MAGRRKGRRLRPLHILPSTVGRYAGFVVLVPLVGNSLSSFDPGRTPVNERKLRLQMMFEAQETHPKHFRCDILS
jgi:hypothetical protein